MPFFPAKENTVRWGSLLTSAFCLLAFSSVAAYPQRLSSQQRAASPPREAAAPPAGAAQIRPSIRVCFVDDGGQTVKVDNPTITLLRLREKVDTSKADEEGCFKSQTLSVKPEESYVIVAEKDGNIATSALRFRPEMDKREIKIPLKLGTAAGNVSRVVSVEICAKDADDRQVPLKDILLAGDTQSVEKEKAEQAGCQRARLAVGAASKLNLVTERLPAAGPTNGPTGWAVPVALLALTGGTLLLGLLVLFSVRRLKLPPPPPAEQSRPSPTTLNTILATVQSVSSAVDRIEKRGEQQQTPDPIQPANTSPQSQVTHQTAGTSPARGVKVTQEVAASGTQRNTAPTPSSPEVDHSEAEAKQKYSDFCGGKDVEHLLLMPVGASSATDMVEGTKVQLREQSGSGRYVAFRPRGNVAEAWLFPMPNMTADVFRGVFNNLGETEYTQKKVEPRKIVRKQDTLWEVI
jgi:hypothetical protein